VFTGPDGRPWHPATVSHRFRRRTALAGLRRCRCHDLRHLAASLQLAAGIDIAIVSKRLGHSTYTITADTYCHLLPGVGQHAAEAAASMVPRRRRPATA
jgi:integrase